jgi:hypothetical protein
MKMAGQDKYDAVVSAAQAQSEPEIHVSDAVICCVGIGVSVWGTA